jgi:hypothetical protein
MITDQQKPVRQLLQFDGWALGIGGGDSLMRPDDEGDWLVGGMTLEPRTSGEDLVVRMHVPPSARPEDVLRVLHKLTAWIEKDVRATDGAATMDEVQNVRNAGVWVCSWGTTEICERDGSTRSLRWDAAAQAVRLREPDRSERLISEAEADALIEDARRRLNPPEA